MQAMFADGQPEITPGPQRAMYADGQPLLQRSIPQANAQPQNRYGRMNLMQLLRALAQMQRMAQPAPQQQNPLAMKPQMPAWLADDMVAPKPVAYTSPAEGMAKIQIGTPAGQTAPLAQAAPVQTMIAPAQQAPQPDIGMIRRPGNLHSGMRSMYAMEY